MARDKESRVTSTDGSLDFSGGVNSDVVTTVKSDNNPNGLERNQLSWTNNCTVRGGGILQRTGFNLLGSLSSFGHYQGSFMYLPDNDYPYCVAVIGGHVLRFDVDNPAGAIDLSVQFGLINPVTERVFFCQAENYLIIQAGDYSQFNNATSTTTYSVTNTSDAANVGKTTIAAISVSVAGLTITGLQSFIVPAVGDSVDISIGSYSGDLSKTFPVTMSDLSVGFGYQLTATVTTTPNLNTLPLFWDGTTLRRSIGITSLTASPASPPHTNELPAATAMCYYMGRVWYAQERTVSAGDIVGGASAYPATNPNYNYLRDAVLCVQENPLCVGGDGFTVPATGGNIRVITYAANINTALGEGQLYIGTREEMYALTVPVTRTDWINASSQNQPIMQVAMVNNAAVNDRSMVQVNGDLFFQSLEPAIRSFTASVRNFQQWGNVPISTNERRILDFNDRSLLRFGSGIYFDNRLYQTALPYICPVGVAHAAIVPLNFDVISTLQKQLPPVWEGMYEGINTLELVTADFGGRQRAFATVWSDLEQKIQFWEITIDQRWDNLENRVKWYAEFPSFTWGDEFVLKKLVSAELWIDKLLGEVVFKMEYRPDGDPCWYPWYEWKECTAKNSCEDVHNPICAYPADRRESYRQTITLPVPPNACEGVMMRPSNVGYQFQCKLTVLGWCRIRGLLLHAEPVDRKLYENLVC